MKTTFALLIVASSLLSATAADASYSTEATISLPDDKGEYQVAVQVTEQTKRHGRVEEKVVGGPITATVVCGRTVSAGAGSPKEGGVTVELSCPKAGGAGCASCIVTVMRNEKVVSVSKLRLKL